MWARSHSKVIKSVNKEAIWDRWADVNNWHEWVPNIEYCRLEKPFQTGSQFTLKPKRASAVTVHLTEVEKGQKFTGCTRFFGATMYDTHEMHKDPEGVRLTVTLKVEGPLGFLWRMLVAEKIANNLPALVRNLANVVGAPALKDKPEMKLGAPASKKPKLQLVTSTPKEAKSKPSPSALKKAKVELIATTSKKTVSQSKSGATVPKKPKLKTSAVSKKDKAESKDLTAKKAKIKPKASAAKKAKVPSKSITSIPKKAKSQPKLKPKQ